MEEKKKNLVVLILIALTLLGFVLAIGAGTKAKRQKEVADRETFKRMDLEEKLDSLQKIKENVTTELTQTKESLEKEVQAHAQTKDELAKSQDRVQKLEAELQKAKLLEDQLERDLKESLSRQPAQEDILKK